MKSKGTRIEHMQANAIHSDSRANATDHSADAMFAAANAFDTDVEFSAEDLKGSKYVARMNTLSSVKMIDQMLICIYMERESSKEGRGIKRGKRANDSERDRGVSGIGHIGDRRGQRGQRERAATHENAQPDGVIRVGYLALKTALLGNPNHPKFPTPNTTTRLTT